MLCPECVKEGQKSCVYPGTGMTTLLYCPPFYDEEGNPHCHDSNTTTTSYTCSRGHSWSESTSGKCWCGWPNKVKAEEEPQPKL